MFYEELVVNSHPRFDVCRCYFYHNHSWNATKDSKFPWYGAVMLLQEKTCKEHIILSSILFETLLASLE
jgi:hypothetical protein